MKSLLRILLVSELEGGDEVIRPDDNFVSSSFPWEGCILAVGASMFMMYFVVIPWIWGMINVFKLTVELIFS